MKLPRLTAQQKELARDAIRDLRVAIGGHTSDQIARQIVLDWLVTTADRLVPGGRTEAAAVVRYLLTEINKPGDSTSPQPPAPPPAVSVPWSDRIRGQLCFMAAPSYLWHRQSDAEVERILDAIQAAGLDGPSFDFAGEWLLSQYKDRGPDISANPEPDARRVYRELFYKFAAWDTGIRQRGLVAHIAFLNSNGHLADDRPDDDWTALAQEFVQRFGPSNKIVLPLSETDSRTRPSVGAAIYKGLRAAGLPSDQLIGYGDSKWGRYTETHKGRGKVPSGNATLLVVNDNGPAIADLYGSDWVAGGTSNPARIEEFARECRRKGVSCAVYSFGRTFDFSGCAAAGRGWGKAATQPDQPAAPGLTIRTDRPARYINWTPGVDRTGWGVGPQKGCDGLLYGCKVGGTPRKVEHIPVGKNRTGLKNAFQDHGDPKYNQGWKSGDRVLLQVRDAWGKLRSQAHQGEYTLP